MLYITIASAPPRREIALLSLACIRKKGDIKDQLYCYTEIYADPRNVIAPLSTIHASI